ncbi:MAG TPA: hemerythrin domain-containing protein [Sandaracinaceae bacterium]
MANGTNTEGEAARATDAAPSGERGIFEQLKNEHARVLAMMRRTAGTNDPEARRELLAEARKELLAHTRGEERALYPALRELDETSDLVEEALEDHADIEQLLDRLRDMDAGSEEWSEIFEELLLVVEDHVDQEENDLFPLAEERLDTEAAGRIEERYAKSRRELLRRVA